MKQILHIFPDGVYAGPEKPEIKQYDDYEPQSSKYNTFLTELEGWQSACMKVSNVVQIDDENVSPSSIIDNDNIVLKSWKEGQLCETKIEDGKKIVTKIY